MLDTIIRDTGYPLIVGMLCVLVWKRAWRWAPLFCAVEAFEAVETVISIWIAGNPLHLPYPNSAWLAFYVGQNIIACNMALDIVAATECCHSRRFGWLVPLYVLRWGLKAWRYSRVDSAIQLTHDWLFYAYKFSDLLVPIAAIILSCWAADSLRAGLSRRHLRPGVPA